MPEPGPEPKKEPAPPAPQDFGHIPMGEEMDRARWTLPPAHIVLVALVIVAVIAGVAALLLRQGPPASGGIIQVFAVDTGSNSVLVTVQLKLVNPRSKALVINSVRAELVAGGQTLQDDAASFTDWERYFTAFPGLRPHATRPIKPEGRIQPGQQVEGTVIFGFPVSKADFDQRQSLSISVIPHNQQPVVFNEKGGQQP